MSKENARGMQDDAISRQVVLNEFCHSCDGWSCNPNTCCKTEWIRKLPTIHPVNNSENPNGSDVISRQAAIDATKKHYRAHDNDLLELIAFDIEQLPSAQPEKLTDIEQRIFLAAMSKEEKVCREVDKEPSDADCINLMRVCKSIERKVKGALWT